MGPLRFELRFRRDPRTIKYVPNAEGWSRLPYGPLLIWGQCIYELHVGQEYPTAAVTCDTQVVHDLGRLLIFVLCIHQLLITLPQLKQRTGIIYVCLTCMISDT